MLPFPPNNSECVCSDLQHDDYSLAYAWFNYLLIIVALPTLSIFGVATNIVNVYIYSRKRMQNSANTYLLFLACSDFLVILTGLFIFWIDSARSYIPELARAPYTTVYTLPFGYMAQTCSIYFTVAAAVDCYINFCLLIVSKDMSKQYIIKKADFRVGSLTRQVNFQFGHLLHFAGQDYATRSVCFEEIIIEICPTSLFFTVNTIYNVYMYMVLMTLLPFLFLLILNAIIVYRQSRSAQHAEKRRASLQSSSEKQPLKMDANNAQGASDGTITMIMVVVLFLCCNTLALIVNIIETFFEPDTLLLNFLTDGSNFLVIFNSSVNCLIYLIFSTEYREVFMLTVKKMRKNCLYECCKCGRKDPITNTRTQQCLIMTQNSLNDDAFVTETTANGTNARLTRVLDKKHYIEHEMTSPTSNKTHKLDEDLEADSGCEDLTINQVSVVAAMHRMCSRSIRTRRQKRCLSSKLDCTGENSGWRSAFRINSTAYLYSATQQLLL
ncbi:unnamed protein product [Anisakis simplex]|uniref:G_PROTEIN_RECEP_F1_2 domain-containing protein n=1 Tax=Anisakis simplex TaxID=6269 RepID=A0A0M3JZT5_ANISI|nr:unnamed protein product [Anisakis simplex]